LFSLDDDHEDLFGLGKSAPLSRRAWCLQESILSRRVLCYGKKQIYWGCGQGFRAADEAPDGEMFPKNDFGPPVLKEVHSVPEGTTLPLRGEGLHSLLRRYHWLVQDFSRRAISFDTDKLPAFSGIAQRLHPLIGGDYLAGIWSNDFHDGLLWSSVVGGQSARHVKPYRVPSWCWAATNDGVWTWRGSSSAGPTNSDGKNDLQLIEHHMEPKDVQNPYGEVVHGYVVVRGQIARLRRDHGAEPSKEDHIGKVYFDEREMACEKTDTSLFSSKVTQGAAGRGFVARASPPLYLSSRTKTPQRLGLPESREYVVLLVKMVKSRSGTGSISRCLVLEEAPGGAGSVYERVGFLETSEATNLSIFDWETRTIKLV
ncbi:hypothetical protein IMZ48_27520, partial [Candidatus Bathyarchaeota archaeon]|nr:hypothetical protein [Candidatus Bathyarchaeota archaeon]